jgi:hypothetical protein
MLNFTTDTPTHLQAHFIFLPTQEPPQKKIKRACKPTHGAVVTWTDTALNVNRLEQSVCEPQTFVLRTDSRAADNISSRCTTTHKS